MGDWVILFGKNLFSKLHLQRSKGHDCHFLGVQKDYQLDVRFALLSDSLQIIFSLKSVSFYLKSHMDLP